MADYTGNILLVGIRSALPLATSKNYDKDTKQHECQTEREGVIWDNLQKIVDGKRPVK